MIRRMVAFFLVLVAIAAVVAYLRAQKAEKPLEWSGTVEARTLEIGSRIGGRVREVLVREGDQVNAGQAVILLEAGDLEGQRLEAEGQLEQAEAALERVASSDRTPSARREEIAVARAKLAAQDVAVEKAELDDARVGKLVALGAGTGVDLDNARMALRNAIAQRTALKALLDQLLRGTAQDVKSSQGLVNAAKGRRERIRSSIDELTIRAPRSARVETLDLRVGEILAPNVPAARLLEADQLFVRIYVPETQLGHIRTAAPLAISVDSFPERTFRGIVEFVSGEGEFSPRNLQTSDERANQVFAARLRLEEGTDVLRAGMTAVVRVSRVLTSSEGSSVLP